MCAMWQLWNSRRDFYIVSKILASCFDSVLKDALRFFLSGGIRPLENVALKKKKGGKLNPSGRSSSPFWKSIGPSSEFSHLRHARKAVRVLHPNLVLFCHGRSLTGVVASLPVSHRIGNMVVVESGRQNGCLYFANFNISAIPTITNLESSTYILQKLSNTGWINIDK